MINSIEQTLRIEKIQTEMSKYDIDILLVSSPANIIYIFGEFFVGCVIIPQKGDAKFFVRRPNDYSPSDNIKYIRKIEQISEFFDTSNITKIALELDEQTYNEITRQKNIFPKAEVFNATTILRNSRMIKTSMEIEAIKQTAQKHVNVYKEIPNVYCEGMTDVEFQIEIERIMRYNGSVGIFRTFGSSMEIYMGSLLAGDNARAASPYDFAMGGKGSEALPLGANGSKMKYGNSVMVDMAGNYGVYLSDMTRTFSIGKLPKEAYRLHELSILLHCEVMQKAQIGDSCADIYNRCLDIVKTNDADKYFMGDKQKAQFVGHGLGLQINELPVLTAKSKDTIQENMVIAFEPKFVLPGCGAVGIENTYLITSQRVENLTVFKEDIIDITNK